MSQLQQPEDMPDDFYTSGSYQFYALWLRGQQRETEAAAVFREAARRQDTHHAHFGLGVSLLNEGRAEEAVAEFGEAVRLKPDWASAFDGLGRALDRTGRYDEAVSAFHKVLRLSPDYHAASLHMGDAYKRKGDLSAALRAYRASAQGYGDAAPEAHVCVADTLLALGETAEAIAILLPLAEQYPNYDVVHLSAGLALAAKGRVAEARQEWQRVLAIRAEFKADDLGDEEQDALAAKAQEYLTASV